MISEYFSFMIPHCSHLYCFFSSDDINYDIHQCIIQLVTKDHVFLVLCFSVSVSVIIEIWISSVVKIMSLLNHIICPACGNGILSFGVEAHGTTAMFQSLSAAQGRVYTCDNCGKSFVKVDDKFLELINSENPIIEERYAPPKEKGN
jgi:predicted RNA-binding Zn-ribbon protein involved in translation (DUF1610 family)